MASASRIVAVRFIVPSIGNLGLAGVHPADRGLFQVGSVLVVQSGAEFLDHVPRIALAQAQHRPFRTELKLDRRTAMTGVTMTEELGFGDVADFHGFLAAYFLADPAIWTWPVADVI